MAMVPLIFLCLTALVVTTIADKSGFGHYHQTDYDVIPERLELVSYNHKYVRHIKGGWVFFNRTQKVINCSCELLVDMTNELKADLQVYKFSSNEYRFFPVTLSVDVCREYENDDFNVKEVLNEVSNIRSCPPKKGNYYIRNFRPDYSTLPPYLIRGSFKMVVKGFWRSELLGEAHVYGTIKDKPMKWHK